MILNILLTSFLCTVGIFVLFALMALPVVLTIHAMEKIEEKWKYHIPEQIYIGCILFSVMFSSLFFLGLLIKFGPKL